MISLQITVYIVVSGYVMWSILMYKDYKEQFVVSFLFMFGISL